MEKNTHVKTRAELRYNWCLRKDKCKVCVNASDCKVYQNGVVGCQDFEALPFDDDE